MASTYDFGRKKYIVDSNNPIHFIKRILVKKAINKIKRRNLEIADIGCGIGVLCQELAEYGKIIGYDIHPDCIDIANSINKRKNISFENKNIFDIKGKSKFDAITMTEVLEYIKDDEKAIIKAKELLKENGYLILTVPINEKFKTDIDTREDFIRYDKKTLVNKLQNNGFKVQKTRYWGFPLINLFYMYIYVPSSNKKANEKKVSSSIFLSILFLKIIKYFFLIDLLFNNKNSFDLFVMAKKV